MDYNKILDNFSGKRILVIGDVILDHFVWGNAERISPEAPVPIVDVQFETYLPGGAGNVANNIASLGGHCCLCGIIGTGHKADIMCSLLNEKKIDISGVFHDSRPTTIKTRVIANNQQIVRFDREHREPIGAKTFRSITGYIASNIDKFDGIIISDYKKGVITPQLIKFLMEQAKATGGLFAAVDPKVGHFHYYKGVSLITPNKKEAAEGSGISIRDTQSLEKAGLKLLKDLKCGAVLITRGDEGMSLFYGKEIHHIATAAKEVYDVTGAGDTVIAAFTLAHISGASMYDAAVISNLAAGIVVGEVGTAATTIDQIKYALNAAHDGLKTD
ncbi:D-glycero-beta-D-manno-heptose-7-phosphate kinase [Candidatus Magnetominusculus dajiuhuensis]|uniref:D-glycero-beta-D-manno-heptose-7-phosphate kinase n=1 Tax=Candidatus Magnetominusculus dajiuhuensis TaxID=3137712 RepID=UPI003B432A47